MNEYLLATRRVGHQEGVRGEARSPWHTFLVHGLAGSPLNTASEYALIQHRNTVASIPSCHLMSAKMSFDDAKSTVIIFVLCSLMSAGLQNWVGTNKQRE